MFGKRLNQKLNKNDNSYVRVISWNRTRRHFLQFETAIVLFQEITAQVFKHFRQNESVSSNVMRTACVSTALLVQHKIFVFIYPDVAYI